MKMTAPELLELGVIDGIVREPVGGAQVAPQAVFDLLEQAIAAQLEQLSKLKGPALAAQRYQKFRRMGVKKEDA